MKSKQQGFSLIELLIVVAIILIIAAIAIPNLLRARITANEAGAAHTVRTLTTAEIEYQAAYPTIGYATSLATLGNGGGGPTVACVPASNTACLIDGQLSTGLKGGYTYTMTGTGPAMITSYNEGGKPGSASTGNRSFCAIEDAVVRVSASTFATAVDGSACTNAMSPLAN